MGADRDQMRTAVRDTIASWRREAERLGVRGDEVTDRALARLGLARREALDDLELRVAQLEHRCSCSSATSDAETTAGKKPQ